MAQVKKELIEITGLSVNAPLVVDGGANGSYAVAAHQIKWGKSEFNGKTFGGTSYGLLTAIEGAIADSANTSAGSALTRAEQAYSYASYVGSIADQAYEAAYNAKESIDTFLNGEGLAYTVDTLKDIQDYITTHGSQASNMLTSINDAKERANAAYDYAQTIETSIQSGELATEITYTLYKSNSSNQGKFISKIDIVSNGNNDFDFQIAYYTPTAEDYWGVYEPSI